MPKAEFVYVPATVMPGIFEKFLSFYIYNIFHNQVSKKVLKKMIVPVMKKKKSETLSFNKMTDSQYVLAIINDTVIFM